MFIAKVKMVAAVVAVVVATGTAVPVDIAVAQTVSEAARQEKMHNEIVITAKMMEINELLHKHAYDDARRQWRTVFATLTEEETRKACAVATQRVARLEELRDFLVSRLPGVQLSNDVKVQAADKNVVLFLAADGTNELSWADMGDVRMVLFFKRVLMDEDIARTLKLREHVRMLINASMYCRMFIPENPHVQVLADKMLEKAVALLPSAKDEIAVLLPKAGAVDQALALANDLVNVPKYAKDTYLIRAGLYRRKKMFKEAIDDYLMADQPPQTLYSIAECYMEMGKPSLAIKQLQEIEVFFPSQAPEAALRIAYVWRDAHDQPRYIAALRDILKKYPSGSSKAHTLLVGLGVARNGPIVNDRGGDK